MSTLRRKLRQTLVTMPRQSRRQSRGIVTMYNNFGDVFFSTQYTTAFLYDPPLPLLRQGEG